MMITEDRINIDTCKLGYRSVGEGPDVVFIHGWPLNKETWRDVAANLDGYRCHLIDLPGSGESITPPETSTTIRGAVDAVVAAVHELGLESFTLVGNDSGGMIARFVAERVIDQVNALVITGSEIPKHHPKLIERLQVMTSLPGSLPIMRKLLANATLSRSGQLLGGLFYDRDLIEGSFRTSVLDPHLADAAIMTRQIEMLKSYSPELVDELEATHRNLTCPTLLIWGEQDGFFPVEHARAMTTQFAGPTRFEVINNARLLVHEEHPERFAALCSDFLGKL